MDILSVSCRISIIGDGDRSVNLEMARDEKGNQIWKVIRESRDSVFVPAPRAGTWTHGSPLPFLWLWIQPEGETIEKTLLFADGVPSVFLFEAPCGGSLKAERAVYYGGGLLGREVSCQFSQWCV